jgi:hypothetical protein
MISHRAIVDQYIVKKDENKASEKWLEDVVQRPWKVAGAFVRPKGMTRNS